MNQLVCWNCGEDLADTPRPISRHASCPACFNELHCCRLCRHYDASQTMRCFEDRADPPLQKENANFCDFFRPQFGAFQESTKIKSDSAQAGLNALFGEPESEPDLNAPPALDSCEGIEADAHEPEATLSKDELAKKKLDDLFN